MSGSLLLAIAVYTRFDTREVYPTTHWALVAHPNGFNGDGIKIFQSAQRPENKQWTLRHVASCSLLRTSETLIGVIELGRVQMSSNALNAFMNAFPATMGNDNPSGESEWSSASWVIRAIHHLVIRGHLRLPVPSDKILERANLRIRSLEDAQPWRDEYRDYRDKLQWIPF